MTLELKSLLYLCGLQSFDLAVTAILHPESAFDEFVQVEEFKVEESTGSRVRAHSISLGTLNKDMVLSSCIDLNVVLCRYMLSEDIVYMTAQRQEVRS